MYGCGESSQLDRLSLRESRVTTETNIFVIKNSRFDRKMYFFPQAGDHAPRRSQANGRQKSNGAPEASSAAPAEQNESTAGGQPSQRKVRCEEEEPPEI